MPLTFTGPDGKDPVTYAAKVFYDLTHPDADRLQRLGNKIVQNIMVRTSDGESYTGKPFVRYSPSTAKVKGFSEPNLRGNHDSDHMLDHVEARISMGPGMVIEIGIFNSDEKAKIARINDQGSFIKVRSIGGHSTHNRRKNLAGVPIKGGRMTHRKVTINTEHTFKGTALEKRPITVTEYIKGSKYKSKEQTGVVKLNRIYVKRVKKQFGITYDKSSNEIRFRHVAIEEKPRVYTANIRTVTVVPHKLKRVRSTTPARPFLGLSAGDQAFLIRNLLPKETPQ